MKSNPELQWRERLDELLLESRTRTLSAAEREELNATLRANEDARAHAAQMLMDDAALAEELRAAQMESLLTADSGGMLGATQPFAEAKRRTGWFQWRPLAAAAAGIVFGMFCTSMVFGYVMPRTVATASRLFALVDGSFENQIGRVASGFPAAPGVWSGDESDVVESSAAKPMEGRRMLRFVRAEGEPTLPNSPADSCDVFQIVDLRSLKPEASRDAMLELSAEFLDARTVAGGSVQFGCHIYLFQGDLESLRGSWPQALSDALGSGASHIVSRGGKPTAAIWKNVTARCVLPPQAEFAVVQLSAGRVPRAGWLAPKLTAMFADDVKLTIKTQPTLPVRVAQR